MVLINGPYESSALRIFTPQIPDPGGSKTAPPTPLPNKTARRASATLKHIFITAKWGTPVVNMEHR